KATAAALLGLAGAAVARRSRASVRHAILAGTFAALLFLPLVALFAPSLPIALPVDGPLAVAFVDAPVAPVDVPQAAPHKSGLTGVPPTPQSTTASPMQLALAAWLLGAAIFTAPAVIGLWQVFSLRRSARPWTEGQPQLEQLLRESGLRRRVDLLLSDSICSPMTSGIL